MTNELQTDKSKSYLKIKRIFSGLRQSLITESPSEMKKYAFCFMLKTFFILEIFTFLSWHFAYLEKLLDEKAEVNFKIYDITESITSNCNTQNAQYMKKVS